MTSIPISTDAPADASVVDSLQHPLAATIRSLLSPPPGSSISRSILIDDEDNILRALAAGIAVRAVFRAGDVALSERLRRLATASHHTIARRTCKKLFGNDKISRVFAVADRPRPQALDALARSGRDIVVLDGIGIAGNIGAVIRTSAAMAVGGVALVGTQTVDPFDRRVIRASRGFVFALPLVTTTPTELVEFCATHELPLLVTTPVAAASLDALSAPRPVAIVFGAERRGCSRQLEDAATFHVTIPMSTAVQSLNVAAAAAIALYSRFRFNRARLSHG